MTHPAWLPVAIGMEPVGPGLRWLFGPTTLGLGRLPDEMVIERASCRFYLPLTTCLPLDIVLSAVVKLLAIWSR